MRVNHDRPSNTGGRGIYILSEICGCPRCPCGVSPRARRATRATCISGTWPVAQVAKCQAVEGQVPSRRGPVHDRYVDCQHVLRPTLARPGVWLQRPMTITKPLLPLVPPRVTK